MLKTEICGKHTATSRISCLKQIKKSKNPLKSFFMTCKRTSGHLLNSLLGFSKNKQKINIDMDTTIFHTII